MLFILHLPPPIHGSSVVGKQVVDWAENQPELDARFINLSTSIKVKDIGRLGFSKLVTYVSILGKVLSALLFKHWDKVYIAITVKGPAFYKDALVVALVKLFRRPIIYHLHNKGVATRQDRFPDKWLYRFVFRSTKVILLFKYLYRDISRFVKEEDAFYCPYGIPDRVGHFVDRSNRAGPPRILFLSNLIESKGVYVLLEACKLLKEKEIEFNCQFVGGEGDISEADFNSKVAELELRDRVEYLGKKFGKDKDDVFESADLFAFPSYYHNETFGLVNLEAMQWCLPVVSCPEGGIPNVVIDGVTGFLVPQRDIVVFADKLALLLQDSRFRQRMGEAGRKHFEQGFTDRHFEKCFSNILIINPPS